MILSLFLSLSFPTHTAVLSYPLGWLLGWEHDDETHAQRFPLRCVHRHGNSWGHDTDRCLHFLDADTLPT